MSFRFRIDGAAEIFKDPTGHYHHWTILSGQVVEGTLRRGDKMIIQSDHAQSLGTCLLDFSLVNNPLRDQVSAGEYTDPICIATWLPALSKADIAPGTGTACSPEEFHETIVWGLEHYPQRFLHDRGLNGRDLPCSDCSRALFRQWNVIHPDCAAVLRRLCDSPDAYIAQRARKILAMPMTEVASAQQRRHPKWMFWRR